ncbi:MAG TPA: hypothetical protein VIP77_21145 [Jiangellaceae bacterium]
MRSRVFYIALAVAMVAIGLIAALALDGVREMAADLEQAKTDNAKTNAELADQKKDSAALGAQVERLGGKPVVDPPAVTPTPPTQGQRGPGPTDAQVNSAVRVICAGSPICKPTQAQVKTALVAICGTCRGEDAETPAPAPKGDKGDNATAAQIDAAVARHCGEDGCRGPGPTDQQVDDRLAVFCADGACKGEKGDSVKGDTGSVTPGDYACPDGEWITAIHVAEGGSMTVDCAPLIGRGD